MPSGTLNTDSASALSDHLKNLFFEKILTKDIIWLLLLFLISALFLLLSSLYCLSNCFRLPRNGLRDLNPPLARDVQLAYLPLIQTKDSRRQLFEVIMNEILLEIYLKVH
jgi:hypothetical protein